MLVNIIHPYTYKFIEDTFQVGIVEEFTERDKNLAAFVQAALNSGIRVLVHNNDTGSPFDNAMHEMAFHCDPSFSFIFDDRVDSVVTTQYGIPHPDVRPESAPEELWDDAAKVYTSHSELQKRVGAQKTAFFIGGLLENCVANAASYFRRHYLTQGQKIFYVKELCVVSDLDLLAQLRPEFEKRCIDEISLVDALGRILTHRQSLLKNPVTLRSR